MDLKYTSTSHLVLFVVLFLYHLPFLYVHNTKSSSSCRVAVAKSRQWQTNRNKIQAVNFIRTTSSTRQSNAKAMAMAKATPATLATRGATNNSHNLGPSSTSFAGFYCHSSPAAQTSLKNRRGRKSRQLESAGSSSIGPPWNRL